MASRKTTKHKAVPAKKGMTVAGGAAMLRQLVERELKKLEDPKAKTTPTQRGTLLLRCGKLLETLGELTGEGLTEKQLLEHPLLRRIMDTMTEALEPHPEAALAVARALDRLRG